VAAVFLAGISLHACTVRDVDSPLELLESSFYSDQYEMAFPRSQDAATAAIAPGFSNWFEPNLPSTKQRRIQASFTNWANDEQAISVVDPMYSHEREWVEPGLGIDSMAPELRVDGYGNDHADRPVLLRRGPVRKLLRRRLQSDFGLGYERIPFAPLVLDTALTSPYMGFRVRSDRGINAPDRLEYLWGKAGSGPAPESRVDLIDTIYRTELGNEKAGFISEMRMRSLDPTINANTVGFGDMLVGGKLLVYESTCTKVSTIFLTHLNTGPERKGLGRGHVALEPGVLAMRKWNDRTYLFGEWKYHVPLGATPGFSGDIFKTGWGIATIWHDTDCYAMIPTFEIQTLSFLFGGRTLPDGAEVRVDGSTAIDLYPGIRWTFNKSAVGAYELGMSGGMSIADRDWFDSRMILELRWLR
jgi:hypothetical protein